MRWLADDAARIADRPARAMVAMFALLVSACGGKAPPRDAAPSRVAKPTPSPPFAPEPTLELLGTETCKTIDHELGEGHAIGRLLEVKLGFGPTNGLAVWELPSKAHPNGVYGLRRIDASGAPTAALVSMSLKGGSRGSPRIEEVVAVADGFVLLVEVGAWAHAHWIALFVGNDGQPRGAAVDLDLDFQNIADVQLLGPRSLAVLAMRDLVVESWEESRGARWATITVRPDGTLEQHASPLDLSFYLLRGEEHPMRVQVSGRPGWLIRRNSGTHDLVVDGKSRRVARDENVDGLVAPAHEWSWTMAIADEEHASFDRLVDGRRVGRTTQMPRGAFVARPRWSGLGWAFGFTLPIPDAPPKEPRPRMRAHVVVLDCRAAPATPPL